MANQSKDARAWWQGLSKDEQNQALKGFNPRMNLENTKPDGSLTQSLYLASLRKAVMDKNGIKRQSNQKRRSQKGQRPRTKGNNNRGGQRG